MHVPDKRNTEVAVAYFKPFVGIYQGCKSVLDLGSGQGHFLEMLRESGVRAMGVEMDAELCRLAREKQLNVVNGDIFDFLQNAEESLYDGCFASHIVEHFLPSRVKEMFSLVHRCLKPGSPFVVITPNMANMRRAVGDFWRDPTHVRPYPISALSKLLGSDHWQIVTSGECSDRKPSLRRKLIYGLRNLFLGRYWVGDDVYVVARRF